MRGKRGQSLVELAVAMPVVMVLLMGIADLSFVLYAFIQVTAATGQGARAGALYPGDLTQSLATNDANRATVVEEAVSNSLGMLPVGSPYFSATTDVQISYPNHTGPTSRVGEDMLVTVTYRQPIWFTVLPGTGSGSYQVSSSTTVRIQ